MEPTTSDTFQEIDGHHHHETNLPIIIVSSMIPTCVVIVLFIVVRKVLIQPIYELRQRSDKPVPDIDRVTNQKIILKSSKSKKLKQDKSNNGKGQHFFSVPVFPREPVYKIQQTPSYIVPFTELPTNFDFSLANVEVYSDFVIIKDSSILQTYWRGSLENPYLVT